MKVRVAIVVVTLACVSGFIGIMWTPPKPVTGLAVVEVRPTLPPESAALVGTWESVGADDHPMRLVVEDVQGHWATVVYTWNGHPAAQTRSRLVRTRALVLPDGKLYWRRPRDFTYQLSEDWTTLAGTRDQDGRTVLSLLRRVPSGEEAPVRFAEKTR